MKIVDSICIVLCCSFVLTIALILTGLVGNHYQQAQVQKAKVGAYCEGWKTGRSSISRCKDDYVTFKQDSAIYVMTLELYEN